MDGYSTVEDGHGFVEWVVKHIGQKGVWVLQKLVSVSRCRKGCRRTRNCSHTRARVALWKRVPLFFRGVSARPPQQCISKLFPQLNAGLVERVNPIQLASIGRRYLQEHHQLPHV